MTKNEALTDEYVAELLAKDAKASIKYSSLGLEDFTTSKPPSNKPKPNTRFLRNIIKDTDSHNAALLAREAAESRARLQRLAGNDREKKSSRIGGGDIRKRQLGDIAAILGGAKPSKRKRDDEARSIENESRRKKPFGDDELKREVKDERKRKHATREDEEDGRSKSTKRHHRRHRSASIDSERDVDDRRRRRRSRSRSPNEHRSKGSRTRQRSPRRKRSKSPVEGRHRPSKYRRSPSIERRPSKKKSTKDPMKDKHNVDNDSDPLDDIIGPAPPPKPEVRSRGRGAFSSNSGIDSRFSADYDPTADVQIDVDEENDWDQALEALRDRQKWKQQGADRLKAAGFTDDEIQKWEKGGERTEEDVKWAKKGEGREWDRGKVLDSDGIVVTEPSFGRLKGD
ncbi:uncharacterized protein BP5553_09632 [Venustampulla echinocandica]|uniref:Uncharacterized protein n=1 Tax=Venustampulla echinocandica TaxID=2656787 RepID=A0A370TBK3_9HELO|nr:uncharacterized protein BP5553_09632 [Venustampulla echinocandica]RDL31423.1 hypothetical protein BP5553_09632 [Venustampulla echinocandica]